MTEIKGQQLYSHAALQTEDPTTKAMFEKLARDEQEHVHILEMQYNSLRTDGKLDLSEVHPGEVDQGAAFIIDDGFRKSLRRGKFEMAVIGLGCDLENKAVAFYRDQAEKSDDPDLKKLFTWMVEWEVGHREQLMRLEKMTQEEYWAEQGFSPM
jgi:rubrerythrin